MNSLRVFKNRQNKIYVLHREHHTIWDSSLSLLLVVMPILLANLSVAMP